MSNKSVLEQAQARFMKKLENEKRAVTTSFGEVCFRPATLLQKSAAYNSYEEDGAMGAMVTTLITRLEDKDGNSIFSPADYDILKRKVDPKEIEEVYGYIVDFDNYLEGIECEKDNTDVDKTKK